MNRKITEIESNRRNRRAREQYRGINEVRKGFRPRTNMIRDKNGVVLVNESEIKERWREYFHDLLNRPNPENPIDDPMAEAIGEEAGVIEGWTELEVKSVIMKMKNNKTQFL